MRAKSTPMEEQYKRYWNVVKVGFPTIAGVWNTILNRGFFITGWNISAKYGFIRFQPRRRRYVYSHAQTGISYRQRYGTCRRFSAFHETSYRQYQGMISIRFCSYRRYRCWRKLRHAIRYRPGGFHLHRMRSYWYAKIDRRSLCDRRREDLYGKVDNALFLFWGKCQDRIMTILYEKDGFVLLVNHLYNVWNVSAAWYKLP